MEQVYDDIEVHKENNDLNIEELKEMIDKAEEKLNSVPKQSVLLLGNTGSGKSTIICLLAKLQIKIISSSQGDLQIDFEEREKIDIDIGHFFGSCTKIPIPIKIQNTFFWDIPGFRDNTSVSQEIINMYCTKRIIDSSSENKIVYLINYHILKANKGEGFAEDIRQLMGMFPDTEKLINSISIVLTHAPSRVKTQEFINILKSLTKQNNYFNGLNDIINGLCRKRNIISVFRAPENDSDKNYMNELRRSINVGIENSCFNKMEAINSLSPRAIEAVECLIKCYENEIKVKMDIFADSLTAKFKSETNLNDLAKNKSVLDKFASDYNDRNFETFISSLPYLNKHFTDSRSIINEASNLTTKIIFFNSYRKRENCQINTNLWVSQIFMSLVELTNRIQIIKAEQTILKEKRKNNIIIGGLAAVGIIAGGVILAPVVAGAAGVAGVAGAAGATGMAEIVGAAGVTELGLMAKSAITIGGPIVISYIRK
ncbi:hypothetical protein SteCoe_18687 [Stentor coeruleus]|uniref:G domain-containing protein n=1 Tax=Stentor coeruleus TaxID=5963 RepID=A0A1R2BW13_9CILI|nr:hypothetical protein SteCoe_18687 [Stentor coeruleus]